MKAGSGGETLKLQLLLECKYCKKVFLYEEGSFEKFECDNCNCNRYTIIATYGYIPSVSEVILSGEMANLMDFIMENGNFLCPSHAMSFALGLLASKSEDEIIELLKESKKDGAFKDNSDDVEIIYNLTNKPDKKL